MWVGEKFQSNPEIAGSPRNSFRASLGHESCGGRALNFLGGVKAYRRISNSECHVDRTGSQTARDKLGSQKGKSPDLQLRSQSVRSVEKDVGSRRQPGWWLRSSHPFKECVIAHWSRGPAPKMSGAETYHRNEGIRKDR